MIVTGFTIYDLRFTRRWKISTGLVNRKSQIMSFAITRRCIKLARYKVQIMKLKLFAFATALGAFVFNAAAWDYEGHHAVNELALAALPPNFPALALAPRVGIEYLAGEAVRWRKETSLKNGTGLALGHASGPDHYLDLEDIYLYGLTPETLPPDRKSTR